MQRHEAFVSKYMRKEDFPQPTLVRIVRCDMEGIKQDSGVDKPKPVLYVENPSNPDLDCSKGIVLNGGNWDMIESITGEHDDTNRWAGVDVVVFCDPTVVYKGKQVGGIKIRPSQRAADPEPTRPAANDPPPPDDSQAPPPLADSEVPF